MNAPSVFAALVLAGALAGQGASYTPFGSSCGLQVCAGANVTGGPRYNAGNANRFAIEVPHSGAAAWTVRGFEIHTIAPNGPITTNAWIYLPDSTGRPNLTPALTTLMRIGQQLDWYGGIFGSALTVGPGSKIFIAFAEPNMDHPISGSGGITVTNYFHGPSGPPWQGPFTMRWKYRLLCSGPSPALAASGVPQINTTFALQLSDAAPAASTVLVFGSSNANWGAIPLPVPLAFLGAPGCDLLVSMDIALPLPANATGAASVNVPVPNDPGLVGLRFHNQWLIRQAAQNPAGVIVTNGGTGVIGF